MIEIIGAGQGFDGEEMTTEYRGGPRITEHVETNQQGHRYVIQSARCEHCHGLIERTRVRAGATPHTWGHVDTMRKVCALPANTTLVATPR